MNASVILIGGIGNIFSGDDGFGVAVAQALMRRTLPPEVRVVDFGIRGMDLAYALLEPYELVILVDAAQRGVAPGTLHLIEFQLSPDDANQPVALEAHGMVPTRAIEMARLMGAKLRAICLVTCEPATFDLCDEGSGLSEPVQATVDEAVKMVESMVESSLLAKGNLTPALSKHEQIGIPSCTNLA